MCRCLQQALYVLAEVLETLQVLKRRNKILASTLNLIALELPSSFRQSKEGIWNCLCMICLYICGAIVDIAVI